MLDEKPNRRAIMSESPGKFNKLNLNLDSRITCTVILAAARIQRITRAAGADIRCFAAMKALDSGSSPE